MPITVEFHFDKKSQERIKEFWHSLSVNCGENYMEESGFPPHITIALFNDSSDIEQVKLISERLRNQFDPVKIRFSALGIFPDKDHSSIFLVPTASRDLLNFHDLFHREIGDLSANLIGHYIPGSWIPHCTLTMNTPIGNVPSCIEYLYKVSPFLEVEITDIYVDWFEY